MTPTDAEDARSAGLRYVDDSMPGYSRKRSGKNFTYFDAHGKRIADAAELTRIKALAVPPAYERVWICPQPNGHIQATGRDARGRKQYRYHARWREFRDANKYASLVAFANELPGLRARVERDLNRSCMSREKVLATVVRLLDDSLVRVGNEGYARDNGSFGLTTLRPRHVRIEGDARIKLSFRGKSGVEHTVTVEDRRLARAVKRCRDLPGELLFTFLDDEGDVHPVRSDDVNDYIREIAGDDISAKDFRTWAGTVECALALERIGPAEHTAAAKRNIKEALAITAARLGNTPAVCRKAYVHPAVLETYVDDLKLVLPKTARTPRGLSAGERRVLAFVRAATKREARKARKAA